MNTGRSIAALLIVIAIVVFFCIAIPMQHNGYLSPSSNVPDNLSAIFGDEPWPQIVSEAKTQLAKQYDKMWSYASS